MMIKKFVNDFKSRFNEDHPEGVYQGFTVTVFDVLTLLDDIMRYL